MYIRLFVASWTSSLIINLYNFYSSAESEIFTSTDHKTLKKHSLYITAKSIFYHTKTIHLSKSVAHLGKPSWRLNFEIERSIDGIKWFYSFCGWGFSALLCIEAFGCRWLFFKWKNPGIASVSGKVWVKNSHYKRSPIGYNWKKLLFKSISKRFFVA